MRDRTNPQSAIRNPQSSVAESLAVLDDFYRSMLIYAAQGDRGCRAEALATFPLWWEHMPRELRATIDFKVDAWCRDHPGQSAAKLRLRKIDMLLPLLRNHRSGAQRLSVAARLPA